MSTIYQLADLASVITWTDVAERLVAARRVEA